MGVSTAFTVQNYFFPSAAGVGFTPRAKDLLIPLDLKWAGSDARKAWFRCAFGWNTKEGLSPFEVFRPSGRRMILSTNFYNELRRPRVVARIIWDGISVGPSNKRWTVLSSGVCAGGQIDFAALVRSPAASGIDGLAEYFGVSVDENATEVQPWGRENRKWPLELVWQEMVKDVVIPYNLSRRRQKYARAYEELDATIKYYENSRKVRSQQEG